MRTNYLERWTEYQMDRDHHKKVLYQYYATGRGEFPFDMLRYDCAWPVSSNDAAKLASTYHSYLALRSVCLHSYRKPEIDRWSSFGWPVGTEKFD